MALENAWPSVARTEPPWISVSLVRTGEAATPMIIALSRLKRLRH